MKVRPSVLIALLAPFFFWLFAELFLRISSTYITIDLLNDLTKDHHPENISSTNKDRFCDSIHKSPRGNQLTAKCILDELGIQYFKSKPIVWLFGGSTTEEKVCNRKSSWSIDLENILKKAHSNFHKVVNYGEAGKDSSYSLLILKTQLKREHPSVIFWNHWINELYFKRQGRGDNQYKTFYLKTLLMRLQLTLYRRSYFHRLLSNILNRYHLGSNVITVFLRYLSDTEEIGEAPIPLPFPSTLLSTMHIDHVLSNFSKSLDELASIANEDNINLVLTQQPYIEKYYLDIFPILNHRLYNVFLPQLNALLKEKSNKYNIPFVDIQKCFLQRQDGN